MTFQTAPVLTDEDGSDLTPLITGRSFEQSYLAKTGSDR